MMTDIYPVGVAAQGNTLFLWHGQVKPSDPPTVAELTATTVLDITCYMPSDQVEIPFDQARDDDTRACHTSTSESFGATTFNKDSISHIVNPQEPGTAEGNLARDAIEANTTNYCSVVNGVKNADGVIAGVLVDVYQVNTGEEHISPRSGGKFLREVKTSWTRIMKGVAVVAGA